MLQHVNAFTVNQMVKGGPGGSPGGRSGKTSTNDAANRATEQKCPIQFKFPKPCIDLTPPDDVRLAIEKCWSRAITTDFKCQTMEGFMKEMFAKMGEGGMGSMMTMSPADWVFLSSFHWLVYFTEDVAPNLCPLMKAETRETIKTSFRTCFLNETNVDMGDMVNIDQVHAIMSRFTGSATNMTTVSRVVNTCADKSETQRELSGCVYPSLLEACIRDPYYKNPFGGMYKDGMYKDKYSGGGKSMDKYPGDKGGPPMGKCQPCYPLKPSNMLQNAWKTCLPSVTPPDFFTKFMRCINWEPKEDKPEASMWRELFTPRLELSIFFNKKSQDDHLNCMYGMLGLGTATDVNPQGFKDMILSQLEGDDEVKEQMIDAVDSCSNLGGTIHSEDFTECTAAKLEEGCTGIMDFTNFM